MATVVLTDHGPCDCCGGEVATCPCNLFFEEGDIDDGGTNYIGVVTGAAGGSGSLSVPAPTSSTTTVIASIDYHVRDEDEVDTNQGFEARLTFGNPAGLHYAAVVNARRIPHNVPISPDPYGKTFVTIQLVRATGYEASTASGDTLSLANYYVLNEGLVGDPTKGRLFLAYDQATKTLGVGRGSYGVDPAAGDYPLTFSVTAILAADPVLTTVGWVLVQDSTHTAAPPAGPARVRNLCVKDGVMCATLACGNNPELPVRCAAGTPLEWGGAGHYRYKSALGSSPGNPPVYIDADPGGQILLSCGPTAAPGDSCTEPDQCEYEAYPGWEGPGYYCFRCTPDGPLGCAYLSAEPGYHPGNLGTLSPINTDPGWVLEAFHGEDEEACVEACGALVGGGGGA